MSEPAPDRGVVPQPDDLSPTEMPRCPAELRGYLLACRKFQLWGIQLQRNAQGPGCIPAAGPLDSQALHVGKVMYGIAETIAHLAETG
ncbi:hypothetical protein [Marinovum algicola]|uniref:hypothetical protein n=1 Tax=Marinovum algicola TaxID=42444 RepID=UPI003B5167CB